MIGLVGMTEKRRQDSPARFSEQGGRELRACWSRTHSGNDCIWIGYAGSTTSLCRQTVLSWILVSLHTSTSPYSRFSRSRNSHGNKRPPSDDKERIRPHASGPHLGHKLARIR